MGKVVCRGRGSDVATTVVDFDLVFVFVFVSVFVFVAPCQWGHGAHLFPAADISVMALSVAAAVILGTVVE